MENKKKFLPKMKYKNQIPNNKTEFSDQLIIDKPNITPMLSANNSCILSPLNSHHHYKTDKQQNILQFMRVKARNIINKTKQFDSPQIVYALSDAIREQANLISEKRSNKENNMMRNKNVENKTFHCFNNNTTAMPVLQKNKLIGKNTFYNINNATNNTNNSIITKSLDPQQFPLRNSLSTTAYDSNNNSNFPPSIPYIQPNYACKQQRLKALELTKWIDKKLQFLLKQPQKITLNTIIDYNQNIISYGLGQIFESVRKRCKEQSDALKYIWDNTFKFYENIFSVFTTELNRKDIQCEKSQKQLGEIFKQNLDYLKKYNKQLEADSQGLYDKMKRVIIWNRQLKKDRHKQDIKVRVLEYRLQTYHSALEEATSMLLSYSGQADCATLAKKIISKLHRSKIQKTIHKKQAQEHVNQQSIQFVRKWLKNYSFLDNDKIQETITLSNQQKLQIMMRSDEDKKNEVDIYDFFQTYSRGVQTEIYVETTGVQYQTNDLQKYVHIGVGTKQVYTMNKGIQSVLQPSQKIKRKNTPKKNNKKIQQSTSKLLKRNSNHGIKQRPQQVIDKNDIPEIKNKTVQQKLEERIQAQIFDNCSENSIVKSTKQYSEQYAYQIREQMSVNCRLSKKNKQTVHFQDYQMNQISYSNQKWKSIYKVDSQKQFEDYCDETSKAYLSSNIIQNQENAKNTNNIFKRNILRAQSTVPPGQTQQTIPSENKFGFYQSKNLLKSKFEDTYAVQMRQQVINNKQQMIRGVVRKRSFYKKSKNRPQQKQLLQNYKLNFINKFGLHKRQNLFNQIDQSILHYFSSLAKNNQLASNISKLKNYQASLNTISVLANSISNDRNQKPIPRNKQFIALSVANITKSISHLLYDYLRKIKADRQNIVSDSQKVYYPLANILIQKMTNKYGLKDIAEKKIKDFLEKVSSFARVNQRIRLFYRLFGKSDDPNQKLGGDQLLLYMKSIVYFDINKTVSVLNVNKDFSIDRAMTTKQVILQQSPQLIKQFFPQRLHSQIQDKICKYFQTYQLNPQFQIQKISQLLIDQFLKQKMLVYDDYLKIHQKCHGNFYLNLYKFIQKLGLSATITTAVGDTNIDKNNKSKLLQFFTQCFKSSDILDETYGKSISQHKFISLCFKYQFPKYIQLQQQIQAICSQFSNALNLNKQLKKQNWEMIKNIAQVNKIRSVNLPYNSNGIQQNKYSFEWEAARIAFEVSEIKANQLLGNLGKMRKISNQLLNKGNLM